ncbi:hypothetical protein DL765_006167 [Monosporascus sp. GIB2]|nr:hypothetical protein DL765_006167 [Monosporascus sp. GIB2]
MDSLLAVGERVKSRRMIGAHATHIILPVTELIRIENADDPINLVHAFDLKLKMVGTCSPPKFDYVKSPGVIGVDRNAPNLAEQARPLTNGEGVDVANDAVGSGDGLQKTRQATRKDAGQVIAISVVADIAADGSGMRQEGFDAVAVPTSPMRPRTKYSA